MELIGTVHFQKWKTKKIKLHIPEDELPITPAELQTLRDNMDPLTSCDDYGISFYLYTRDYVKNIVSY